ncbi:MAG: peptidylprolyl isomerase, partial [Planctomycetia bacterium]|nr:peptidylprolyl isomerase [Planctomycetia bacterium]
PAGTYTIKADSNSVISGTLRDGVTVVVGTTAVTKDVPIDGVAATGDILLNTSDDVKTFVDTTLAALPLPTAGTGQSTGINEAPTLRDGQPDDISLFKGGSSTTVDLTGLFDDPNIVNSQVKIRTSKGDVNVDLLDKDAPRTVENFYHYVNADTYDNSIFHRLASGFVLQGGGFKFNPAVTADPTATPPVTASPALITAIPTNPAVENEFDGVNRSNLAGTVAMAKLGSDPNSATNQFFFNLANNSSNLDNQNGGFTVFGRLVGAADIAVVDNLSKVTGTTNTSTTSTTSKIKKFDAANATGVNASVRGTLNDIPLDDYKNGVAKTSAEITSSGNSNDKTGSNFATDTTAANFLRILGVDTVVRDEVLTYTVVSNSNPTLFSDPTHLIKDNRLTLTTAADQVGTATIVVRATDKHGVSTGTDGNPDATFHVSVSAKPVFTSATAVNVAENTTAVQTVVATDADVPAQTVTYSISGGADKTKFNITTGGVLTFNSAPNFELPTDANTDNVYAVQVKADDGNGGTTTQNINVTVTAVSDNSPVFTSAAAVEVNENATTVLTVVATDADLPAQTVTYSISDGADKDLFDITSGGVLTFKSAPNFEAPTDAGTNNVYAVQVSANDGAGVSTTQDINVTVTAANDNSPTFISSPTIDVTEGNTAVGTVLATDADLPTQTVIYSIIGGADKDLFDITTDGALTFKSAPSF